jgi:hypothetical protein
VSEQETRQQKVIWYCRQPAAGDNIRRPVVSTGDSRREVANIQKSFKEGG